VQNYFKIVALCVILKLLVCPFAVFPVTCPSEEQKVVVVV
jgi:hypothetical protein